MAKDSTDRDDSDMSFTWQFPCDEWFGMMPGHKLQRDLRVKAGERGRHNRAERPSITDSESVYSVGEN